MEKTMHLTADQNAAILAEATRIRVPYAHLAAVVQVESNGVTSAGIKSDPKKAVIRWEGHYFDARLSGEAREEARRVGLSSPKAGAIPNPAGQAARYAMLQEAVDLCKRFNVPVDAAYESASWGIGQVMGANWHGLGFDSVADFVKTVNSGFAGQLNVMVQFILLNSIDDELRDGRWASFARVYNGKAYKKNRYDVLLAGAAKAFGGEAKEADGMLRVGAKGARVRELQALLVTAGYVVKVDGDFGPTTRDALKQFQKAGKITPDGVYGPQTERLLTAFRQPGIEPGKEKVADIGKVKTGVLGGTGVAAGIVAAKETLEGAVAQLAPLASDNSFVSNLVAGLTVAATVSALVGLAYAGYGYWKSKQTEEV